MQSELADLLRKNRKLRRAFKWWKSKFSYYSDWSNNLKNEVKKTQGNNKSITSAQNILLCTSVGGEAVAWKLESMLGVALNIRGQKIEYLLCDGSLPACQSCTYGWYRNDIDDFIKLGPMMDQCSTCYTLARNAYNDLGFHVNAFSGSLDKDDYAKIKDIVNAVDYNKINEFTYYGIPVGEHAYAGALRFFAKATLENEKHAHFIVKKYFEAALLTYFSCDKLFKNKQYDVIVLHHGIYVPQGIISTLAKRHNIRVVTWNLAYRKNRFIFSHGDTYHHTLIDEPVSKWESEIWDNEREHQLNQYLDSRWFGNHDWIKFQLENPIVDTTKVINQLNIDKNKKCIGMLTNVLWDAQLHYPANAFNNMLDWVISTIEYFKERSDLQLIIRIHPAEITGKIKSRQLVSDEIKKRYPILPENIVIIPPNSEISTYAVLSICDSAIIYGTKMGVELTSKGIPVIVAGEAWIRNKGLTDDAETKKEYINLLDKLPYQERLDSDKHMRAKKYAYHFFFRRMIPLETISATNSWPPFKLNITSVKQLLPGKDKGLDVICNGIVDGSDFIFDASK